MRIFTDRERQQMTRKPCDLDEVGGVAMSDQRLHDLIDRNGIVLFPGSLEALGFAILAMRERGDDRIEFLAQASDGRVYAVNTEGCDYARYVGQVR